MTDKRKNKPQEKKVTIKKFWLFIGVVTCIWLISWGVIDFFITNVENQGIFGDKFGAINALFSGLAFAGLIYTILLQHEELGLQRQELRDTREELEGQKIEAERQNSILLKQQFENTFFQLIQVHHNIVNAIEYCEKYEAKLQDSIKGRYTEERERFLHGRAVFEIRYWIFANNFKTSCLHRKNGQIMDFRDFDEEKISDKNLLLENFYGHYKDFISDAGHYFRNLYRIVKYIDEHTLLSNNEKYNYIAIVRSQLSDFELSWMFYNCISLNGSEKFKPLIEKYALLHNLPNGILISEKHRDYYLTSAYEFIKS